MADRIEDFYNMSRRHSSLNVPTNRTINNQCTPAATIVSAVHKQGSYCPDRVMEPPRGGFYVVITLNDELEIISIANGVLAALSSSLCSKLAKKAKDRFT